MRRALPPARLLLALAACSLLAASVCIAQEVTTAGDPAPEQPADASPAEAAPAKNAAKKAPARKGGKGAAAAGAEPAMSKEVKQAAHRAKAAQHAAKKAAQASAAAKNATGESPAGGQDKAVLKKGLQGKELEVAIKKVRCDAAASIR